MARPLGFTDEKKRIFLEALVRTERMREAAAEAGVMPGSVAWARKEDAAFRAAFDAVAEAIREGRALAEELDGPLSPEATPFPSQGREIAQRHDGFTAAKRKRFLLALGKTGCVADAARVAHISRNTANRWRAKDAEFGRLCEAALHKASSHIEILAWDRGVTGIEEPIVHQGRVVGMRRKRSDAIFRMILMASNAGKYGRMGAASRKEIELELRARIEAERGPERRPHSADELRAIILAKLEEANRRLTAQAEGEGGALPPPE